MRKRIQPPRTVASMPKRGRRSRRLNPTDEREDVADMDRSEVAMQDVAGATGALSAEREKRERKWPLGAIPVELFQLICSFLPRPSVQNMRLVCREFDHNVSAYYFRNVVAPFRTALYASPEDKPDHRGGGGPRGGARTVFETFGVHIRAFALALELSEADLAYPPIKMTQEVIKTAWGLYRWPLKNYQRYRTLEAIEDQADETAMMTKAFSRLTGLQELGLSCDAGLGYLQGSDINAFAPKRWPRVFKSARYAPPLLVQGAPEDPGTGHGKTARYRSLVQMMQNAGYSKDEVPMAIDLLLLCEGKDNSWVTMEDSDDEMSQRAAAATAIEQEAVFVEWERGDPAVPGAVAKVAKPYPPLAPRALTTAQKEMLLEMTWAHDALVQSYVIAVTDNAAAFRTLTSFTISRIPGSLLHALIRPSFWDSLAAVEEVRLGVVADWREVRKENSAIEDHMVSPTEAVGAAYIVLRNCVAPRSHIRKLHFEWVDGGELAVGLSQRNRYVLPAPFTPEPGRMVAPDVVTQSPGELLALPHVRELSLRNCWFSPHVLLHTLRTMSAASLTSLKLEAVSLTGPPQTAPAPSYLALHGGDRVYSWPWPLCIPGSNPGRPFLYGAPGPIHPAGHLAPNLLIVPPQPQGAAMAPPLPPAWGQVGMFGGPAPPPPGQAGQLWPQAPQGPGANVPAPQGTATPESAWLGPLRSNWIPVPRLLSWAHLLNELTPDEPLQLKYAHLSSPQGNADHFVKRSRQLETFLGPSPKPPRHIQAEEKPRAGIRSDGSSGGSGGSNGRGLQSIEFRSCGYILVDADHIDNMDIIPGTPRPVNMPVNIMERLRMLDLTMLRSYDRFLGRVLDDLDETEESILKDGFGLRVGWAGVYSLDTQHAAHEDGFLDQGRGRFSGGWRNGVPLTHEDDLGYGAAAGSDGSIVETIAPSDAN